MSSKSEQAVKLGRVSIFLKPRTSTILQNQILCLDRRFRSDFTTVYTVSKDAQMVGDVLEQLDAETMSDIGIFIQAKETQMNFSEEFSNTVVRLGGLPSALNYLTFASKKFPFYVSAIGNISFYDFMTFITLSVFNDF